MSDSARLCVCVGDFDRHPPGWLSMHGRDDAEIPYLPGDDFPFEDSAVDVMACGNVVAALPREGCIRFLLECRRVLKPRGLLSLPAASPAGGADAAIGCMTGIAQIAALAGLEAADAAPVADGCRAALAELRAPGERMIACEYTKRDRQVRGDPLVSIVIPAYKPRFFAACLGSALAQTHANIEIVVCDDSEGTEIEAMVRGRAINREIRYLRNAVRLRPRGNFIKCFESARGEFVKFLCDDDLLAPTCVASLLDTFRRAPGITLATSRRQRIDEHGNRLGDQPATLPIVTENTMIAGYTLANVMLMAGLNMIGEPSTTLFRKADLLDQAPDYFHFNAAHGHGIIDMVMWSALLLKGDAVYLTECLSAFRIHAAQRQHDPAMAQRTIASIRGLQAAWLDLGLFEKVPPHLMLAKLFPPPDGSDWHLRPVLSRFAGRRDEPRGESGPQATGAMAPIR
jgi:glycosyltransferase involved in cell wall biosynthesis